MYHNASASTSTHAINFLNEDEKLILTVILSGLTLIGIFVNVLVVYVVISLGTYVDVPANLFILSQAIAHLGNTVSTSCYISHMYHWNWHAIYALYSFTLFSSLGSLCLLTINRLISITWPLKYTRRMTPVRARLLVAFVWLAASSLTLLHTIGYLAYHDANFFNYGRYYSALLVIVFLSSNLYMYCKSREHARRMKENLGVIITGLQKNLKEDLKCARTVGMVSLTFLLGWLPLVLLFFFLGSEKEQVRFQRFTAFLSPLVALNVISDPVIYYVRGPEFRVFYRRWKRRHGFGTTAEITSEPSIACGGRLPHDDLMLETLKPAEKPNFCLMCSSV